MTEGVLAFLSHSILGEVNPCTPGSVRHGSPPVSVKIALASDGRPWRHRLAISARHAIG